MMLFGPMDAIGLDRVSNEMIRSVAESSDRTITVPTGEGASLLAVTGTDGSYPTSAGVVYVCSPIEIDADDVEGASFVYAVDSLQNFYAVNTGSNVPVQGTAVICHLVGGRWCFRF